MDEEKHALILILGLAGIFFMFGLMIGANKVADVSDAHRSFMLREKIKSDGIIYRLSVDSVATDSLHNWKRQLFLNKD
jgi:hypothetical protein